VATTARFVANLAGGTRPVASVAFLQAAAQALHTAEKRINPALTGTGNPASPTVSTTTAAPATAGGTSLSGVINAVTVNRAATPEQFATLYAMVARYVGVPARVVSGFRISPDSAGRPVPAGTYRVTDRQAWAWVEVPVAGLGWVICDPTPDVSTGQAEPPPDAVSAPATTVPPRQANVVPRSQAAGGHALAPRAHIPVRARSRPSTGLYVVVGTVTVVLMALFAGPGQAALRRGWRRRRRRSSEPDLLAVGAWLELLDGLDRRGMRPPPGATASEIAEEVGHHFGADLVQRASAVAGVADRAVFSTSPVAADAAVEAWATSRAVCREVVGGLDRRQRLRSALRVGDAPSRPSAARR
jgi:hypothetical protein